MNAVVRFADDTRCMYEELEEIINVEEATTPVKSKSTIPSKKTPKVKCAADVLSTEKVKKSKKEKECVVLRVVKGHQSNNTSINPPLPPQQSTPIPQPKPPLPTMPYPDSDLEPDSEPGSPMHSSSPREDMYLSTPFAAEEDKEEEKEEEEEEESVTSNMSLPSIKVCKKRVVPTVDYV